MGLVTGDALGNAIQFMSREEVRERGFVHDMEEGGVYETPAGTWTDDSSMALATLDSIREIGAVVPEDIMLNFVSWECHGEYTPFGEAFDEGNTCTYAIMNFIWILHAGTLKICWGCRFLKCRFFGDLFQL